jgi:predicted AAA+ superfamily ATPase
LGHPVVGASWEGFVVENIINLLSKKWRYSYYRTVSQTEIDLVLESPANKTWAIEIKRSLAPEVGKGFHNACEDIEAGRKYVLYSGTERYLLSGDTEVIGLVDFLKMLRAAG